MYSLKTEFGVQKYGYSLCSQRMFGLIAAANCEVIIVLSKRKASVFNVKRIKCHWYLSKDVTLTIFRMHKSGNWFSLWQEIISYILSINFEHSYYFQLLIKWVIVMCHNLKCGWRLINGENSRLDLNLFVCICVFCIHNKCMMENCFCPSTSLTSPDSGALW